MTFPRIEAEYGASIRVEQDGHVVCLGVLRLEAGAANPLGRCYQRDP